jgi:hypothetical protein
VANLGSSWFLSEGLEAGKVGSVSFYFVPPIGRDFLSAVALRTSGGNRLSKCNRVCEVWAKFASNRKHLLQSIGAGSTWIIPDLRTEGERNDLPLTNEGRTNVCRQRSK